MALRMTYVDGEFRETDLATVSVEDRAFQFGDGVYEVVRICRGRLFAWQRHLERLRRSSQKILLDLAAVEQEMTQVVRQLIDKSGVESGQVYIQISRGQSWRNHAFPRPDVKPTLIVTVSELPMRTWEDFEKAESAVIATDDRWLHCDIKSTSLLPNVLAREKAVSEGAQEAIFARDNRIVTEGSASNVFMVSRGVIYTHPDGPLVLPGITKELTKMLIRRLGIPFEERPFTVAELRDADEVFITGTGHDVCPIVEVDHQSIGDGKPGVVTRMLNQEFRKLYEREDFETI